MTSHAAALTPRLTFAGTLRSEVHKLGSVPAIGWLVLLAAPATALGVIGAAQFGPGVAVATGSMVGGAVVALLAGLSIAGEYATGAVRTTLTAAPRRTEVMLAKSLAVALVGLVAGWLGALAGAAAIGVLGTAALSVLATGPAVALTGLVGLYLGSLIRRVAPTAITTTLGLFLFSGMIGGLPLGAGSVGDVLFSDSTVALVAGTPDPGRPLVVVLVWLVVAAVAAGLRFRSTDA
ncbi:hypothetical protein [Curtobacterium sp. MCBA15_001]|uniref:hypothetical protein n=1 Tax=Curtobacterium sp. MCBA15_001 TaxID=1898731 RepID=UPI0008DCBE25|nr:hypothetical protein [Curtobacterium sp. MCBA15_001]OIH92493.1 hypothetical protein BIU90_11500 [Curtobacterium sp. MCBA15_001]